MKSVNMYFPAASSHKKKNKKKVKPTAAPSTPSTSLSVDSGFLCCAHHEVMVAGLSMLGVGTPQNKGPFTPVCLHSFVAVEEDDFHPLSSSSDVPVSVFLVGLGGGGLPQFLRDFVPNVTVEVVELDPTVMQLAKEWFEFRPDDRLTVTLGDGLERICALEKEGQLVREESADKSKAAPVNMLTNK